MQKNIYIIARFISFDRNRKKYQHDFFLFLKYINFALFFYIIIDYLFELKLIVFANTNFIVCATNIRCF